MRKLPISILILVPLVTLGLHACDEPAPVEPESNGLQAKQVHSDNPFVGSWIMTSAVVADEELLVGTDAQYIMTFGSDGTYSISVSNDTEHIVCTHVPETSCSWDGTYEYTLTDIELDESEGPEPGPDSMVYLFCGGRLFLMDFGVRLTFKNTGKGR